MQPCSLGFFTPWCYRRMLKHGEYEIVSFLAVDTSGNPVPPCGHCRELLSQLSIKT
ncbi:cytidine deaminase [Filibacter limicola]|uniref:Cytidine deaminase n=1 Tax=Sporosarcina limicola TaxID=34101 RepID=A0A927MP92_9BACL|nr:cytidine deaminase [Sporosarcina limicola]